MTLYYQDGGVRRAWAGGLLKGVRYPLSVETLWTDAELEAVGLYRLAEADTDPLHPQAPPVYRIAKDAIWRRATDAEAEAMEQALAAQPIRVRRIYEGASHVETDDPLFGLLQTALIDLFGADRAAELLAPG